MQNGQENATPPQPQQPPAAGPPAPTPPARAPSPPPPPGWYPPPPRKSRGRKIVTSILVAMLILSVVINMYLLAAVIAQLDRGMSKTTIAEGEPDQIVAFYTVAGMIDDDSVRQFRRFCTAVHKDANVKAVLLRVKSPGGSVSSSDEIHDMVGRLQQAGKKVVVSMGGLAASGGYYISAGADSIVAEPTTVTGSIGVMGSWPVLKGTLEKLGMEMVVMKSSHARGWKDEASWLDKPNARHRKHLQEVLDKIQDKFERVVKQGRADRLKPREASYHMKLGEGPEAETVEVTETEPFNGKIYLAEEAEELGLVDQIGYRDTAIDAAAVLAGLSNPHVVEYELRPGLLSGLMRSQSSSVLSLGSIDELQTPRLMLMWKAE